MAIIFIQQRKKEMYLIFVVIIITLATCIIWLRFLTKPKPITEEKIPVPQKELKINFEILNSQILNDLQPFEEINPYEGTVGRENPFLLYKISPPKPKK